MNLQASIVSLWYVSHLWVKGYETLSTLTGFDTALSMFVSTHPTFASLLLVQQEYVFLCPLLLFQLSFSPHFGSLSWLWFPLGTRVHTRLWCQPAVVSTALREHCDSPAWPQLSFRPRPKLTAERGSWGCCQTESWVSSDILMQPTVLEPAESLQCENLRPLWQQTKPERAWSEARGVDVGLAHTALRTNHNHNLWSLQIPKVDFIWTQTTLRC